MTISRHACAREDYSGTFALTKRLPVERRVANTIDSTFRGIGQILLVDNPLTGLLILVGLAFGSVWTAFLALVCALVATLVAQLCRYDRGDIRMGFYGFNGSLIGCLAGARFAEPWTAGAITAAVIGAGASAIVMKIVIELIAVKYGVPALTLPFALVGTVMLLVLPTTASAIMAGRDAAGSTAVRSLDPTLRASSDGVAVTPIEGIVNGTLRGISQVFFVDSIPVVFIVISAILVATRLGALMMVAGSLAAVLSGVIVGGDGFAIYHGLWGYSGAVVGIGLFGVVLEPSKRSAVVTIIAAAASGPLYGALLGLLGPLGLTPLSFAIVLIGMGTVLACAGTRVVAVPIPEYSTPEQRLRLRRVRAN